MLRTDENNGMLPNCANCGEPEASHDGNGRWIEDGITRCSEYESEGYDEPVTTKTLVGTIDITPEGCKTPEGAARVDKAMKAWDDATHALANATNEFFDTHEGDMLAAFDKYSRDEDIEGFRDDLHQLRALIGARRRKQDEFLMAVGGR